MGGLCYVTATSGEFLYCGGGGSRMGVLTGESRGGGVVAAPTHTDEWGPANARCTIDISTCLSPSERRISGCCDAVCFRRRMNIFIVLSCVVCVTEV